MASEDDETASENDAADFDIVSRQHDEQVATLLSDLRLNTQRKLIRRELTDPCVASVSAEYALSDTHMLFTATTACTPSSKTLNLSCEWLIHMKISS